MLEKRGQLKEQVFENTKGYGIQCTGDRTVITGLIIITQGICRDWFGSVL